MSKSQSSSSIATQILISMLFIMIFSPLTQTAKPLTSCPAGQYVIGENADYSAVCNSIHPLPPLLTSNLIGYWALDEGSGTNAFDLSGNGNTGTLTNSPIRQSGTNCEFGNCLNFVRANSQYISLPALSGFTTQLTLSIWIKYTTIGATSEYGFLGIRGAAGDPTYNGWGLYVDGGDSGKPSISITGNFGGRVTASTAINDGLWHLITGTYDGTNAKIYIDGVLSNSAARTLGSFNGNTGLIGATSPTIDFLNGNSDDARVYNIALTPTQILQLDTYGLEYHN